MMATSSLTQERFEYRREKISFAIEPRDIPPEIRALRVAFLNIERVKKFAASLNPDVLGSIYFSHEENDLKNFLLAKTDKPFNTCDGQKVSFKMKVREDEPLPNYPIAMLVEFGFQSGEKKYQLDLPYIEILRPPKGRLGMASIDLLTLDQLEGSIITIEKDEF